MNKIFGFSVAALVVLAAQCVQAQSTAVADLQQDMAILKREVGNLRLEVEQFRRDNDVLAAKLRAMQNSSTSGDVVRAQVASVKSDVSAQNNALKREIIAQVKKDIENLAEQTNTAIGKLAKAIGERPQAEMPKAFDDDYPKTGITYTVKSGDTLGKIARANNSRIKWIQNANKISDPSRGLHIGDSIFVPQK